MLAFAAAVFTDSKVFLARQTLQQITRLATSALLKGNGQGWPLMKAPGRACAGTSVKGGIEQYHYRKALS